MHVSYRGNSSYVQGLLDEVTAALPQQVQRFVMEKVCFIAVGKAHGHGQTWHKRSLLPSQAWGDDPEPEPAEWVITLSEDGIKSQIVAHEIAHAVLNHPKDENDEAEADALAANWKFPRPDSHEDSP